MSESGGLLALANDMVNHTRDARWSLLLLFSLQHKLICTTNKLEGKNHVFRKKPD